jgi:hypothetical protein
MLRDRQQRKCPFARRKKNISQRRGDAKIKTPLCAFPTLRLCVNLLFIKKSIGNTVEIA